MLVYERDGYRQEYHDLPPEQEERILRNQAWLIREAEKHGRNLTPAWKGGK